MTLSTTMIILLCFCVILMAYLLVVQRKATRHQRESLKFLVHELRDQWDHLPRSLPISEERQQLAYLIGTRLPGLFGSRMSANWVLSAGGGKEAMDTLVKKIDDPEISRLWAQQSPASITQILRTILFAPLVPGFEVDKALQQDGPMAYGLVLRAPKSRSPSET